MSTLSQFLFGSPGRVEQRPITTPEQQQVMSQLIGALTGGGVGGGLLGEGLQNLQQLLSGTPEAAAAFERPALRQFQEEIVPGIAERFTGLGAQRSSAFGQQLAGAGQRLAESLQAQRGGLQQQALSQLLSLLPQTQRQQFQPVGIEPTLQN